MRPIPIPVTLLPYDPSWAERAAQYSAQLTVLGDMLTAVHHIGSTSVPGLIAKPIIDLMPLVTNLISLEMKRGMLEDLGYVWFGELGISGRRYCSLTNSDGRRLAQLHFFEAGSPHVTRHLAFRNYLRAHPDIANEYAREKEKARALHPQDSHAYTDAKAAWVSATEAKALAWAAIRAATLRSG